MQHDFIAADVDCVSVKGLETGPQGFRLNLFQHSKVMFYKVVMSYRIRVEAVQPSCSGPGGRPV